MPKKVNSTNPLMTTPRPDGPPAREVSTEHLDFLRQFIAARAWRFARTMPKNPHWYIVRQEDVSFSDFWKAATLINYYGEIQMFQGRPYLCLILDGFKYWVYDHIINRAVWEEPTLFPKEAS